MWGPDPKRKSDERGVLGKLDISSCMVHCTLKEVRNRGGVSGSPESVRCGNAADREFPCNSG